MNEALEDAYRILERSVVQFEGAPVGTIASSDPRAPAENYRDCFIRDFVPSAIVYLLDGQPEIVRNFLQLIVELRGQQDEMEGQPARQLQGPSPGRWCGGYPRRLR